MENRNFFRALFWALLVFLLWSMIAQRIWPTRPPAGASPAPSSASLDAGTSGLDHAPAGLANAGTTGLPAGTVAGLAVAPGPAAETFTLGDVTDTWNSPYRMEVVLSNVGAAVDTVRLSDHAQGAEAAERYQLLSPVKNNEEVWRSFAVERIHVDDQRVEMRTASWQGQTVAEDDGEAVIFSTQIFDGSLPVLALERRFKLPKQPAELQRHDFELTTTVRNLSDAAHRVQLVALGPFGIIREGRYTPDQKVFAAVREAEAVDLEIETFQEVGKKKGIDLYSRAANDSQPLIWYGSSNVYFTATICPLASDDGVTGGVIKAVQSFDLDASKETEDDVGLRAATADTHLAAGAALTLRSTLYLGPKDRNAFEDARNEDYIALDLMQQIKQGYGSCTFNFLTDLMIALLNWLEGVFGNFGVAIICLVVIVRVLLHPVTKKTQVNMVRVQQRMAKLHPKIEEIKRRCAGDAMRLNQETMKLYREEGVNPMSQGLSCLPMFLQMPIWVALYSSLSNNVAMRGEGFVLWINDLTKPDELWIFANPITIPLLGWKIAAFHLLPLLVGIVMFAQQKLMPKPSHQAAADSPQAQQAEQMQKIMPYMSLMMIVIFYNFPSGLNLYIMTSSLIGAVEQIYIRRHISQKDLEPPAVPAGPPKPARRPPALLSWLQKKAEEAQKMPSQREQGKRRR